MEVNRLDWTLVPLIDLNHTLRTDIIQLNLSIVRAGGHTIPQVVELDRMDDPRVLFVRLDLFLLVDVPNVDKLIIA